MSNEDAAAASRRTGLLGALAPSDMRRLAWYAVRTLLGVLLFAGALSVSDIIQFHTRMPGYIVLYWFPGLMAGRALAGYRGSGLIVGMGGGMLANGVHPTVDDSFFGFALAAFIVEGIMYLASQSPAAWLCVVLGMAASIGKLIPKVAVILMAGATPHHNRMTIPFMLQTYLLFGGMAGLIYLAGRYTARKAQSCLSSRDSKSDSGSTSNG